MPPRVRVQRPGAWKVGGAGDSRSRGETDAEASICVSGYVKEEKHLEGKPAILDIPRGDGRVIIFSFKPLHRYLTHASFALAYNAILHWNDR